MHIVIGGLLLISLLLAEGCTSIKIEHPYQKESISIARTQMPETTRYDAISDRYAVPAPKPFESDDYIYRIPIPTPAMNDQIEIVRLQSLGDAVWLHVKARPSQLWPRLKQFVSENSWAVAEQRGETGSLIAVVNGQVAHFNIFQGFQDDSSELYLRVTETIQPSLAQRSSDMELERQLLEQAEAFLSAIPLTAYSYIAQNISTEQRMIAEKDSAGYIQILLKVDGERAFASLKTALELANFAIEPNTNGLSISQQYIIARYMPQPSQDDQPNWLLRLFGAKEKTFNPNVENAGHTYQFTLQILTDGQLIRVSRSDGKWSSERSKRNEMNAIMRLLKGSIN